MRRKDLESRCTPIESAIQSAAMLKNTVMVRRKSRSLISAVLALVVMAGPTIACNRRSPTLPPRPPLTKSQPPPEVQRPADANPFPDPTFLVLVGVESTPPGVRMVRVSDGWVLGYAPDTIEFHQSSEPVLVRFEKQGYLPVTQAVSAASDGNLKIVLEPIPKKHAPATTKSKASNGRRTPN